MGGMEHGEAASRTAVAAFLEAYARKTPGESVPGALERSVNEANAKVVELARNLDRVGGIGTTLVAAVVRDTSLFYVSVGDSGLFHLTRGRLNSINHPHVFSNLLDQAVARGSMSAEEAHSHPERESLTSYIGAEKIDEIDQNQEPWPLHAGETILLASDGMFKTLTLAEIQDTLQGDAQRWAETLVERTLAKQREYQDNVTVLTVTLDAAAAAVGGDDLLPTAVMPVPSALHPPTLAEPAPARVIDTGSNAVPTWDSPIPVIAPPAPVPPPLPPAAKLPPASPPARGGKPVWLILLVLLILGAVVAAWWLWLLPGGG
jgi:serine/threonine protein phosphatase PrpC